jgi:hypothetical protein
MEIQARTERWETRPRFRHDRSKFSPSVAPSRGAPRCNAHSLSGLGCVRTAANFDGKSAGLIHHRVVGGHCEQGRVRFHAAEIQNLNCAITRPRIRSLVKNRNLEFRRKPGFRNDGDRAVVAFRLSWDRFDRPMSLGLDAVNQLCSHGILGYRPSQPRISTGRRTCISSLHRRRWCWRHRWGLGIGTRRRHERLHFLAVGHMINAIQRVAETGDRVIDLGDDDIE